jgi:FMN reductase
MVGKPLVVGIGGTTRVGSTSERALVLALHAAAANGAETLLLTARDLEFPMYAPEREEMPECASEFIAAIERADGLIVASPGYHGGVSGLLKNALDYVEELREAERPYLDGRAVGCIACASGWQAATTTLVALRSIVHALRGWPTPLGVAINSATQPFAAGQAGDEGKTADQLGMLGRQVAAFARDGTAADRAA